jgi:phospholipid/cholesterol/gamma-HCH transport system substrate-binding protein
MKTTSALIKLVIFVAVTALATAVLAVTITNAQFGPKKTYHAVFTDATGLISGDDVRIAGVQVGQVTGISLYPGNLADVSFTIRNNVPLSVSTQAALKYRNIVGQRYLELSEGAGSPAPLQQGATIPLSRTTPALDLNALFNGFRPLLSSIQPSQVNQLAYSIIQVFQGEGGTIDTLLGQVASLTSTLADHSQVIDELIQNLNSVLATVDAHSTQLTALVGNLKDLVSGLAADRTAIGNSLTGINQLTVTTGNLLTQARPPLKGDISSLNKVAGTLDKAQPQLQTWLNGLPGELSGLDNVASYGSWANMYLCTIGAKVSLPGSATYYTPQASSSAARCG